MFKKTLYIIVSLGVGMLVFLLLNSSLQSASLMDLISEVNETKEYSTLERLVGYCIPKEEYKLYSKDDEANNLHVELYTDLTAHTVFEYKEGDTENASQGPTLVAEALELMIFNYKSFDKFKIKDTEDILDHKARVVYNFNDGTSQEVYFINGDKNLTYYRVNFYNIVNNYGFLTVPLFYSLISETQEYLVSIQIYDDYSEAALLEYSFGEGLAIKNSFDQLLDSKTNSDGLTFRDAMNSYNDVASGKKEGKLATEFNVLNEFVNNNDEFYAQLSQSAITKRPRYIVWMIVMVVLYIAVDAFVGFMLFKKKKAPVKKSAPTNIPPRDHARQVVDTKAEDKQ